MMRFTIAATLALATPAALAQPASYAIEPTHTFVYFEVSHLGTSTSRGRFDRTRGSIELDRAGGTGRVEITIETASVSTGVSALDKRLLGPDFLDVAQFPSASFVADRFAFDGDKLTEVAGMLTLRGQAHPVTLKATHFSCTLRLQLMREVCGGDFEAQIERTRWGIDWGIALGIPDRVRLLVQVEAIRQ